MKNNLFGPFILVITALCAGAAFNSAAAGIASENQVLGIRLATKVSAIVHRFGKPSKIEVPTAAELEASPEGQWFRWRLKDGIEFSVLGDEYSVTPNYGAGVRFIQYMTAGKSETKVVYGFKLNKTMRRDVETKFIGRTQACTGNYGAPYYDVLKLTENEQFTYFFFSPSGLLIGVAQSTFDMDIAG